MKTEDLKLFLRVVELGSFTAAANALDLPRANVSRRINDLEKEINTQLFHRTTRSLSLTHNGESYFSKVQRIVELLDDANQEVTFSSKEVSGRVKLGLIAETYEFIQSALFEFHEQYPNVEIDLRTVSNGFKEFYQHGLDISFHGGKLEDSDLIAKPLITLKHSLLASPEYLQSHAKINSLEDLKQHEILCYRWPSGSVDNLWLFDSDQILVSPWLVCNSVGLIRRSLVMGKGISFLPDAMVQEELEQGKIVRILSDLSSVGYQAYLLHPKPQTLNHASRILIDYLAQKIPEYPLLSQNS
ncbi:LysR family transcriptional regulator [Vibrio superstes]|uniref:Transcriptional regulator n=1 Tax=Vibrio superstes NBRC 103154 TaxID=1219062 RepID=A0A511QSH0_9VIBR|nr:LysR family transcriptional regulator [Vibrio superstes]GEM80293.1 transcriptional regulator [Vibrio superstes NBRC 103154]